MPGNCDENYISLCSRSIPKKAIPSAENQALTEKAGPSPVQHKATCPTETADIVLGMSLFFWLHFVPNVSLSLYIFCLALLARPVWHLPSHVSIPRTSSPTKAAKC